MTASRSTRRRPSVQLPADLRDALQEFLAELEAAGALSTGTLAAYRRDLEGYLAHAASLQVRGPADLRAEVAAGHMAALIDAGRSPATVARSVSSMRRFHEHLRLRELCPIDPTQDLTPPRVRRRDPEPLTVDEAERLVSAVQGEEPLDLRDRAILEVLYAAGLRVSELTALRPGDLLLDNALLRVHGRGARERMVPLGRAAVDALGRYLRSGRPTLVGTAEDDEGPLFLNARGQPLSRMSVWKTIRAAARAAGIERPVNPQTLRHTFAAHLLEGGFDLRDVQSLLGHADISTTLIYSRADDERLQALHRAYHPRA